jgi:hypothetical protein
MEINENPNYSVMYFTTGIMMAPYDDLYRRKHQLLTSIFRQLGYGQRIMENRIIVEVAELISQARLINGQPFDPTELLNTCVLNVSVSMQLG